MTPPVSRQGESVLLRRVAADNGVTLDGLLSNAVGWVARYDGFLEYGRFYMRRLLVAIILIDVCIGDMSVQK